MPTGRLAIIPGVVDPSRKRKIRLVIALSVAVLLAVALIYTSFSASTQAKEPSQILTAAPGTNYEMNGKVVPGSIKQNDNGGMTFEVKDREGGKARRCRSATTARSPTRSAAAARSSSPARCRTGTFVGEPESLITKCPSKFTTNASESASS